VPPAGPAFLPETPPCRRGGVSLFCWRKIQVDGVAKRYGEGEAQIVALDDVSLSIEPRSVVAITGPSGSGRWTLLHLVGTMDAADARAPAY